MRAILLLALLAGCERTSALYCEKNPDQCTTPPMIDGSVSPPMGCTSNAQCTDPDQPMCIDMMVCGQCAVNTDCTAAAMPTCDTATHDCRACKVGSDCASQVCLGATGTCAMDTDVAYVGGANASGTACTLAVPCPTIEDALALAKRYIRLVGNVTETNTVTFDVPDPIDIFGGGFAVHIKGPGFRVADQANVGIENLEIAPTTIPDNNSGNDCIYTDGIGPTLRLTHVKIHDCGGDTVDIAAGTVTIEGSELSHALYGVEILNSATASIARSIIHHNAQTGVNVSAFGGTPSSIDQSVVAYNGSATDNTYPGIDVYSTLNATNTIIALNGALSSSVGGVRVNNATASVFDFVTIADNLAIGTSAAHKGMTCVAGGATISNSIITGNQPSTACIPTYTLLDIDATSDTNKAGAPMFTTAVDPTDPTFYHLTAGSPAIGAANPASTVAKDIDGDARPAGHADMGADQFH